MSLRFICIELRENLRCANVFLQFDQNLTETEFVKINLKNGELQIKELSNCISFHLDEYFALDASTLTNLAVEENNASFRLSVGDIVKQQQQQQSNKDKGEIKKLDLKPLFEIGQATNVCCNNCKGTLFNLTCVLRMREFPTGAIDTGEFFCHAAADFTNILVPRICDIFYGFQFLVINPEHLENAVKLKSGHIYCRRCLQYLGSTLFNNQAYKLWSDTLAFKPNEEDDDNAAATAAAVFHAVQPKVTTVMLLQKIIGDCSVDDNEPMLHSMNFAKVILETTYPNRKRKYIMIQILEKQLKILRNEKPFLHNSCNNNNVLNESLLEYKGFKLLYRFIEETEEFNGSSFRALPVLLQYWQQDVSIQTLSISHVLFNDLLKELVENSHLLPEFYRNSKDDFKLSYVFYRV